MNRFASHPQVGYHAPVRPSRLIGFSSLKQSCDESRRTSAVPAASSSVPPVLVARREARKGLPVSARIVRSTNPSSHRLHLVVGAVVLANHNPWRPLMAASHCTGASALLTSEIRIGVYPRACTHFLGTAAQLTAEGLIPEGFEWPTAAARVTITVGKFSHWLGRQRPEGHKGAMRSWIGMDNWFLRRSLTAQEYGGRNFADVYEKSRALAEALRRGTPEWERLINALMIARFDGQYQAFRNLIVPAQKRGRGRPSKKLSALSSQGAAV